MTAWLVPVVTAVIAALGGWLVARINASATRATGMTPSYEALDRRNASLEGRISDLEDSLRGVKTRLDDALDDRDNFAEALDDVKQLLRDFVAWINSGSKPPPPTIPAHLRDQVGDYELARITETTHTVTQTERTIYPEES